MLINKVSNSFDYLLFSCIFILFLLLFWGAPDYYSHRIAKLMWENGHIAFFALITPFVLRRVPRYNIFSQLALSFTYAVLLGTFIEFIQSYIGRDASIQDIYRGALGAVSCNLFLLIKKRSNQSKPLVIIFFFSLLPIIYEQKSLINAIVLELEMYEDFPALASFNSKNSISNWSGQELEIQQDNTINKNATLKATLLANAQYSTLTLKHFLKNWNEFKVLEIELFLVSKEAIELCFKITDLEHNIKNKDFTNRFNLCKKIQPKLNKIKINLVDIKNAPLTREFNLYEVSEITLFSKNLKVEKDIHILKIGLNDFTK